MNTGMMITAAAGPGSNIVLAFLSLLILVALGRFAPHVLLAHEGLEVLLWLSTRINIALAIFNMLPIPPLDGSRVVEGLMPYRHRDTWASFTRFAPMLLLVLVMVPSVGQTILGPPMTLITQALKHSVFWLVGSI
jgi:Zn-dependent protease